MKQLLSPPNRPERDQDLAEWRLSEPYKAWRQALAEGKVDKRALYVLDELNHEQEIQNEINDKRRHNDLTMIDHMRFLSAIGFCKDNGFMQKELVQETL